MSVFLYGASLTYKSSICKTMHDCIPGQIWASMSNSVFIDAAKEMYPPEEVPLAALYGRAVLYSIWNTASSNDVWFDRGLLDQYVWCKLRGTTGNVTPNSIYDFENTFVKDKDKTYRFLLVNEDIENIRINLNPERMAYLGINNEYAFMSVCNEFNSIFIDTFPTVPIVRIKSLQDQLMSRNNKDEWRIDPIKVLDLLGLDNYIDTPKETWNLN